jgi:hypothetical protein
MSYRPDRVRLEHSTGRAFLLLDDVAYVEPGSRPHAAHAGLSTDFATIPHSLWSVIAPFGQVSLPAIVHDQECQDARNMVPRRSAKARLFRARADARFHRGLLERGVPRFRAAMMWAGVSLGRYWDHGGHVQRFVMLCQLVAGYAAIAWGAFHVGEWGGWAAIAAPAVAAAAWWRSAPAMLLAQYPGLIILAIGFVNFVASLLEWLPNVVFGARPVEASPARKERTSRGGRRARGEESAERARRRARFRGVGRPPGFRILPR